MQIPQLNTLLSKEMNRKEFLIHIGMVLLIITGVSSLLQTLAKPELLHKKTQPSKGFGSGPYGV